MFSCVFHCNFPSQLRSLVIVGSLSLVLRSLQASNTSVIYLVRSSSYLLMDEMNGLWSFIHCCNWYFSYLPLDSHFDLFYVDTSEILKRKADMKTSNSVSPLRLRQLKWIGKCCHIATCVFQLTRKVLSKKDLFSSQKSV